MELVRRLPSNQEEDPEDRRFESRRSPRPVFFVAPENRRNSEICSYSIIKLYRGSKLTLDPDIQ